jgi:hypothetical protein
MNIIEALDKAKKAVKPANKIDQVERMNLEFAELLSSMKQELKEAYPLEGESIMKQMEFNANFSQTYLNKMRIDGMEEQNKATIAMKNATFWIKWATIAIAAAAIIQLLVAVIISK